MIADTSWGLITYWRVAGGVYDDLRLVIIGLVITGQVISIPIVVFGSTLVRKFISRFTAIIYVGAGILAFIAAKMVVSEPFVQSALASLPKFGIYLIEQQQPSSRCWYWAGIWLTAKKRRQNPPALSQPSYLYLYVQGKTPPDLSLIEGNPHAMII